MQPTNSATNKTMIYLFSYAPTAWDAKKFGFDILRASGINLIVFNMSALVSSRSETGAKPISADFIKKISSYHEFEQAVIQNKNNSIFIDNINGLSGLQWAGRQIFSILKKYNIEYYVLEVGSLPIVSTVSAKSYFNKFKKVFQLTKLFAYLRWRAGKAIVNYQWRHGQKYQMPTKIFIGNSETRAKYLAKYHLPASTVVPIHSFDYDRYLDYNRNGKPIDIGNNKICVFIDQMLATHPDFGNVNISPVTVENYFRALNKFFNHIEKTLGLTVVIAACPRANYDNKPELFGNRKVFYYQTVELVAQSSLVLMHTSTAVSFPVLFNKPIFFMRTREMARSTSYLNLLENMAANLKLTTICIDDDNEVNKITAASFATWPKNYDDYKYKYVMTKDAKNSSTWEILIEEFCGHTTLHNTEVYA
jgi:hypothetical protein